MIGFAIWKAVPTAGKTCKVVFFLSQKISRKRFSFKRIEVFFLSQTIEAFFV